MTIEQLEALTRQGKTVEILPATLEAAAQDFFDSVEFVDPPKDFMETTQAEAEKLDE